MKKVIYTLFLISIFSNFLFAIDDIIDKDNLHNLIDGVNSSRAGTDRISSIYDFAPMINHETPFKLGVSLLDLRYIFNNEVKNDGSRQFALLPKGFVGLSYGIFALGYQFGIYSDLSSNKASFAHSHSIAFGFSMDKYRFNIPISILSSEGSYYGGKLSISTTPKFSFLFRSGILNEFTISLHYGVQLSNITNDLSKSSTAPMVIGANVYGDVMLTRFEEYPVQISLPIKLAFYYGIGSRWATIDAGYAEDALLNYIYDDEGGRSSDSIRFFVVLPAKFEAKLGAIYLYAMPRVMFEGNLYKTDGIYNLHYGMEGEIQFTPVENLTFGLTAYGEGQGIMRKSAEYNIQNAFGAGLDIWGIWRY